MKRWFKKTKTPCTRASLPFLRVTVKNSGAIRQNWLPTFRKTEVSNRFSKSRLSSATSTRLKSSCSSKNLKKTEQVKLKRIRI